MAARLVAIGIAVCAILSCPVAAAALVQPIFGPQIPVATMTPGGTALDLTNADFTGDGRQDVLVLRGHWASETAYPISILVGDGAGGFSDKAPALFGGPAPSAVWPRQALLADFNGDGRTDIFVGDSGLDQPPFPGHADHLALSTAGGGYVDADANLPPAITYFHSGATGDVDRDGDIDIFLADLGTPIRLLLNDGTGHFSTASGRFPASVLAFGHERYTRSALVDVNGDRTLDLVLLAEDHNPSSTVLLNDGTGAFTEVADALPPKPFGTNAIGIAIQAVELTGDGRPDLLLGYTKGDPFYVGRWIQVAVNNGDGTFHDETSERLPQADNNLDWPYEIVPGDLNSDGAVDFGVDIGSNFCCPGKRVAAPFYLNRGNGTFAPLPPAAFADPPFGQLRLIDVNRDGLLDVFGVWQAMPFDAPEQYVVQLQARRRATLRRAGAVRAANAGKRGIRLYTGVKASCPPARSVCRGRVRVTVAPPRRRAVLGSAALRIGPGAGSRVSLRLGARGAAAVRRAGRLRVRIAVTLTGPDHRTAKLVRTATIRPPR